MYNEISIILYTGGSASLTLVLSEFIVNIQPAYIYKVSGLAHKTCIFGKGGPLNGPSSIIVTWYVSSILLPSMFLMSQSASLVCISNFNKTITNYSSQSNSPRIIFNSQMAAHLRSHITR